MERVLVEGTVKEARVGTIGVLETSQRRDRVPEAKTLGMKGFHGLNNLKSRVISSWIASAAVAFLAMTGGHWLMLG